MSDQIRRNDMNAAERLDQIEARANEATEGPWVTGATPLAPDRPRHRGGPGMTLRWYGNQTLSLAARIARGAS